MEEQVVKISHPTTSSVFKSVLSEEELDRATGGGTGTPKNRELPKESLSLNFSRIDVDYKTQ